MSVEFHRFQEDTKLAYGRAVVKRVGVDVAGGCWHVISLGFVQLFPCWLVFWLLILLSSMLIDMALLWGGNDDVLLPLLLSHCVLSFLLIERGLWKEAYGCFASPRYWVPSACLFGHNALYLCTCIVPVYVWCGGGW